MSGDGRHVLYWSSRLAPTRPNGDPIRLQRGPVSGYAFWAMDTDGSVLVAAPQQQGRFAVYDCEVPAGECVTVVDDVRFAGGDPMFIGVDM